MSEEEQFKKALELSIVEQRMVGDHLFEIYTAQRQFGRSSYLVFMKTTSRKATKQVDK